MKESRKAVCKKIFKKTLAFSLLPVVLLCSAGYMYRRSPAANDNAEAILLLVPDDMNASNMVLHEWLDAAEEEGVHVSVIHDSEFLNPLHPRRKARGLIVPDLIHRSANSDLIGTLHDYVNSGGSLMLVYDAGTWDLNQHFARVESRLSDLAGVSYALYDRYCKDSIQSTPVWGTAEAMAQLGIPPGKDVAVTDLAVSPGVKLASLKQPAGANSACAELPAAIGPAKDRYLLTRYQYGDVQYPAFRTSGDFDGTVLLQGTGELIAGERKQGLGRVLFVNLPLGYLEARTDGILLHSFLHYFAARMIGLPYLAAVPDGVGGLVFNWHIDASSSIPPLNRLLAAGVFDQGPYSIHMTVGPDVDQFGDRQGLDLEHNPEAQRLLGEFVRRHHAIGSHGGWIHNWFGEHLGETEDAKFANYISMNMDVLQRAIGGPITEYSAPVGNQPQWVTRWLEHHGVLAYYFAGDTGMAPTEVYRDDTRDGHSSWAFPIVHLGKYASLEEMGFDELPPPRVEHWLTGLVDYVAQDRVARLLYTHPLGATRYIDALQAMLRQTRQLATEQRFRWYTMTGLATFLNARKAVTWRATMASPGVMQLEAQAPTTLQHQTWILSKAHYGEPRVESGCVQVHGDEHDWLVTAGDCKLVRVEMALR